MTNHTDGGRAPRRTTILVYAAVALLAATLGGRAVSATTYMSAEPIPAADIVGSSNLTKILGIGYPNLELWSQRLLNSCHVVDNVVAALAANGAIHTVNSSNTVVRVAAGGFEGITDPSYVFTVQDTGTGAVSAADVSVLDNALGYVLNQGGTAHFNLDNPKAYAFPLDYAVVTFPGTLSGEAAKAFFDSVGLVDPALWSGQFAGFTQVDLAGSPTNNSMVFLKPAATKRQFIDGLYAATTGTPSASYSPIANNGQPTTAKAGIAFPGNDWIAFPNGDQYLSNLGTASPQLLSALATLRQQHLQAVGNLLRAIDKGNVGTYLDTQFKCPR
jgi:hypothetical protein